MLKKLPQAQLKTKYIGFKGGLDQVTPPLVMASGNCRAALNAYQDINGGYHTLEGYERYDGQVAPSIASYAILNVTITGSIEVGDTITGEIGASPSASPSGSPSEGTPSPTEGTPSSTPSSSPSEGTPSSTPSEGTPSSSPSATPSEGTPSNTPSEGTPSSTPSTSPSEGTPSSSPSEGTMSTTPSEGTPSSTPSASPSEGTPSSSPYFVSAEVIAVINNGTQLVITKATDVFPAGDIKVGGVVEGSTDGTYGSATAERNAYYLGLAADSYRADIGEVPGSGSVLGIWYYDGDWYAFRNSLAGTTEQMYKATANGWTLIPLGRELSFTSGGTYLVKEGDVIEGAISGATATITRVVLESGDWSTEDAAGRLIFASQTGTFQAETLNVGGNSDVATIASDSSAITFANPGGRFEFINENFSGSTDTYRMYGVDGVNRGFEFDGQVFVPIETGMLVDTPTHVYAHTMHLFYSYYSSAQHSAPGEPYQFTPITGTADELAMGDHITGFLSMPGSETAATLGIYTRNSIAMLYGTGVTDWNLVHYRKEAGAHPYSMQLIGRAYSLDDRGITELAAAQRFGNFTDATVSALVQPFIQARKSTLTASCVVREKNQYWLFFSDKSAMCLTVKDGKVAACMPMLLKHQVTCVCSAEIDDGNEVIMIGCSDGYVRQLFSGTSFDGEVIEWYIELAYNHFNTPSTIKRFRRATMELEGTGYAEFLVSYALGYGASSIAQPGTVRESLDFNPEYWDIFTWDNFTWDGLVVTPASVPLDGSAENISLVLRGIGSYFAPLKFSGALVQFTPTREKR